MTAYLSSLYNSQYSAAKCINGDRDWYDGDDMCHTQKEPCPWIALDFATSVTVNRVELVNRRNCCGERTRNVYVRISDELPTSGEEMFKGGNLLGSFTGPGTDGQQITISGQLLLLILCSLYSV